MHAERTVAVARRPGNRAVLGILCAVALLALGACDGGDPSSGQGGEEKTDSAATNESSSADTERAGNMADAATIKDRIIGNTVAGTMSPDSAYTEYYAPDGSIHGAGYQARWQLDGDRMCFEYDEAPQADCYQVRIEGDAVEWQRDGETQGQGTIVKGNPNDF